MILYFDTETTGLIPGKIIQLSYILENDQTVVAKNFFFDVPYIEPSASAVHGFTVEKIKTLSQGKTFCDSINEIEQDFTSASLVVAHNFKFDLNFMIAEFNYQYSQFTYNESFDTMKCFTPITKLPRANGKGYKYPKLTELLDFLGIYTYDVTRACSRLFGTNSVVSHDARFDTVALYLAMKEGGKNYAEVEEIRQKHLQK